MSETEASSPVTGNEEASVDTDVPNTESENDAEKEELKTPDESKPTEPEDKSAGNKAETAEKKPSEVELPSAKPTSTSDQTKSGECNLLPVLVERLRSALEQSCSSQSSEDPQPLEDSGIDSEEDLRMWASGLCHSIEQNNQQSPKPLDLKFLEDLLLSDIQTALSRLQDTLKRVDVNTLTKYNSTLDSTNKLHLLRLISNLLSKLKIPEELTASGCSPKPETSGTTSSSQAVQKRRRANRHTIGVSAEEIAHARKLLDEKNLGNVISPDSKVDLKPIEQKIFTPVEKPVEIIFAKPAVIQQAVIQAPAITAVPELKSFEQVHDKHVKDAINQQQTYYNKNKEFYKEKASFYQPPTMDNNPENLNRVEIPFKDESFTSRDDASVPSYYQQPVTAKYNKFNAKKSKIKRANTIDIPNYLKLQAENFGQNQAISLRRPIDIGDKSSAGNTNIIPAFKPKTDNDRKFLALINKNNDAAPSNSNLPFKSFNYRQPANVDKNWNNRFSNIKTTFDKPTTNFLPNEETKSSADSSRRSQSGNSDSGESDGVVVGSLRLAYVPPPPKQKQGGFTHAPTSPFQKIEKSSNRNENASIFKSGYLPKGGNSLQAKVKIFNQDNSGPPTNSIVAQNKNKFNKINDNSQYGNTVEPKPGKLNHNGSFNYKQNSDSNKNDSIRDNALRSYLPGNRNVISSKLIVNANVNDESINPKVKTQYPYLGYQSNTGKNKADKIQSNDELQNRNVYSQFPNANSYPDKLYASYNQPKQTAAEVPPRTSSHSFMLQKIANENNYETKPKVNRYVNEALKIKDNKDARSTNQPLTSHYIKPVPPMENCSSAGNVSNRNHPVHMKHTASMQNYPVNNDQNLIESSFQELNPARTNTNSEYKPAVHGYASHDAAIDLRNVPNQASQAAKVPVVVNTANNIPRNVIPPSYDTLAAVRYSTHQTNDPVQFYDDPGRRNPLQDVKAPLIDPNYEFRGFSKSYDNSNERYSDYPTNESIPQVRRMSSSQEGFADDAKPASKINSVTGKIQSENNSEGNSAKNYSAKNNKRDSNYIPYESYQTKIDSGPMNEHLKNYQDANYYDSNTGAIHNERLQSYGSFHDERPSQNQKIQYNPSVELTQTSLLDENNSDKEIQMYAPEPEPTPPSTFDLYQQKEMLLEDENIQNQDISSDGIVTRYQCAIATVATTPESSEADVTEMSFQNPKLYNMKIAAYPTPANEHSNLLNANYSNYNKNKISVRNEPEKEEEVVRDESADAFEEIQRHNLLQQQIIQKLQNDDNSAGKDMRRRSLDKFKWDEKSQPEIGDRRSSYYDNLKSITVDDKSPTSPSPIFPFNKTNSPPKQSEEPVIECNNTLEKINIFEEKSLKPLPSVTRQRFRPLSIPKFDKTKDFQPPKINVVTPSKIVPKPKVEDNNSSIISSSTNMCDSSDEYLMSCASRQSRSIVLSKSESWHQLALSRGNLQPPQPTINHLLKPPKPKSPASLKLSKQYEASSSADNMKRMEEKIQRYFHSPTNIPGSESHSSSSSSSNSTRRESKSKRHFSSKKNSSTGLARSHTMPHLYDDKLLEENTDVEKAFDSLFMEATRADNRY